MVKPIVAILTLVTLSACQPEAEEKTVATELPGKSTSFSTEAQAACAAEGGSLQIGGLARHPVCVKPTPDAGAACSSSDECTGFCLSKSRSCTPITPMWGCYGILDRNGRQATLCVD